MGRSLRQLRGDVGQVGQDRLAGRQQVDLDAAAVLAAIITQLVNQLDVGASLVNFFSFFTIQSNLLVLVSAVSLARNPHQDGPAWRVVRVAGIVGILDDVTVTNTLVTVHFNKSGTTQCDLSDNGVVTLEQQLAWTVAAATGRPKVPVVVTVNGHAHRALGPVVAQERYVVASP